MIDASGRDVRLEVDGGVNPVNLQEIARAGADMFVVGSALLKAPRTQEAYRETILGMRKQLAVVT
jgi:ribulose-phosphate 3-epimerase